MTISSKIKQHEYRVDRAFAQGDIKQARKTLVRFINGKRVETKIKANSPNQERINDALIDYFQRQVRKQLEYFELRNEALSQLEDKFNEFNLNKTNLTIAQKRIKAGAIQQVIDKKILDYFKDNPKLEIGFEELLEISKLKSVNSFKFQVEIILSIIGRAAREIKRDVINLETMTIKETKYSTMLEIIGVDITIDKEISEHFPEIMDLVNAERNPLDNKIFRNKKKYVSNIVFTFSKEVLPYIISQGTNFVSLNQNFRQQLILQNTFAIDTYITSIQHAQEYRHLTDFTPELLQKKFGHNYKRFDQYLQKMIDPCISDINRLGHKKVSYMLKRKGYEWGDENAPTTKVPIEKFRWIITNYEKSARDDIDSISYYISLKILKNDNELKNKFDSIRAFAISIKEQIESEIPTLTILGNKTIEEWKQEALKELIFEEKIIEIFKNSNIIDILYDRESMKLISSVYNLEHITMPSESFNYLMEILKVKEPKKKITKMTLFPIDDVEFIEKTINSAIELDFYSPLHFFFTIYNFYIEKNRKSKEWENLVNLWLTNNKYNGKIKHSLKIELIFEGISYVGIWNNKTREIETDSILFTDITTKKLAKLISIGNLKMYGTF